MRGTSYASNSWAGFSSIFARIRPLALPALFSVLGMGVFSGCDKGNDNLGERRYCDQSGCYACSSDNKCYPVPGDPAKPEPNPGNSSSCDTDAACPSGSLCNLGHCETACADDAHCSSGQTCISGRCRPMGAPQCGIAGALCTADAQCAKNSKCVNRACATDCTKDTCALGQVCTAGSCIEDPSPMSAQCQYDADCNAAKGGFRCVNAYCLPTCSTSADCTGAAASCVKGLCRGNRQAS